MRAEKIMRDGRHETSEMERKRGRTRIVELIERQESRRQLEVRDGRRKEGD